MSEQTSIEWCDHTWSPWEGCTKISPGCDRCYAAARNGRFSKGANWGPGAPRRRTADWRKPRHWNRKAAAAGKRESVFPSLCDPFDNAVPDAWRADLFELIGLTDWLDWLLLTKRIGNAAAMLPRYVGTDILPNVRIGATMVNQQEIDRDLEKLIALDVPNFVSLEPLLGPIVIPPELLRRLDWCIVGGESGHGARPMHPDWARSLRDQCAEAGVRFLFKQWGQWLPVELPSGEECYAEDGSERALEGRIHVQRVGHQDMARMDKKAAGRLLDGVTHDGFPEAS